MLNTYPQHVLEIGETHATITEPSGRVRTAKILDKTTDATGRLTAVLLDTLVHQPYNNFGEWEPKGCYVTEFFRKPKMTF